MINAIIRPILLMKILVAISMLMFVSFSFFRGEIEAATFTPQPTKLASPLPSQSPTALPTETPSPLPRIDITQSSVETVGPLEKLIKDQEVSSVIRNPLKAMIKRSIENGVPANTIVLLLLLPIIATIIAAARHLVGLQGFGILLPAALATTFLAIGPVVGISLFLVIVAVETGGRMLLKRVKLRLHYLPRMAFLLSLTVVALLGVLFLGSTINVSGITNASIFPVLFLVVFSEDFVRVQLGKSFRTAFNIGTQTLILALVSYIFVTSGGLQRWALLNPEIVIGAVIVLDVLLGKFSGLRFLEYWRFRKLISK